MGFIERLRKGSVGLYKALESKVDTFVYLRVLNALQKVLLACVVQDSFLIYRTTCVTTNF
jgi:hypothetical protein